ncbi:MAG TPA: DNA recombination protein RmuC [Casimicrobiaceae bacterium]|nr:DNA recombination protein RmuC [Casimicrobiaceae bacterium]
MSSALTIAVVVALVVVAAALAVVIARLNSVAAARDAATREIADLRTRVEVLAATNAAFERDVRQDLANARAEAAAAAQSGRTELGATLAQQAQAIARQLSGMAGSQSEQMQHFGERLAELTKSNEQRLENVRSIVEQRLDTLRSENAQKLEAMRETVDEKLQTTLAARLGESFKQVSDRLDQVHKGLGEMQTLALSVGDLRRMLTNVKTRGGWGEVQLGTLLGEMLLPAQFAQNVATRPGSGDRVEYAVKLPGRRDDGVPCWLPIDAKFPLEDYQRLQDAIERADGSAVEAARRALETFFKAEAKSIRSKYVEPPHTTDFAILFVPTEGLYAEAMSRPGLADALQREHRVMLCGPMNLAAMLNSLQLGFRTLAIEQRSTEVWAVLGAVKTEFGKFGQILVKTKERLDQVGNTLEEAARKSTTITRKLRDVEALPEDEAERLLAGDAPVDAAGDLFEAETPPTSPSPTSRPASPED